VMVTSLECREGQFSFIYSLGSATCPDYLSSAFAYSGSSTLKRDIALPLLAFRFLHCPSVSSRGVCVLHSQLNDVLSYALTLLRTLYILLLG